MALAFAALGWAGDFGMLLVLAALAGLGLGAYHLMGAMNASLVIERPAWASRMARPR